MAVMECAPTDKPAITQVAVPATATARAPQPAMVTPPSWKLTVPVLVPDAGAVAVTVAVKVTHVVVPAASARLTQPAMLTPPSWKVTVPVGVGPTPLTAAVKVTDWPNTDGLTEDVTVVVDGAAASAVT